MKKVATTFASIAMLSYSLAMPASAVFASTTTLEITGNGSESSNEVQVASQNTTTVVQNNNANIQNNVSASSSSGGNSASKNTGGDVTVDTGNSKTLVSVENAANTNTANVDNCNCGSDATVKISGNGEGSTNEAGLELLSGTTVAQVNSGTIKNEIDATSDTGTNKASRNTGGDVNVSTGDAFTHVEVTNNANSNWANVGGNSHGGSEVSLLISGNGSESENSIWLGIERGVVLQQENSSYIKNEIDAESSSGYNKAGRNTGGEVGIDTGNAHTGVLVDNAANFNWANLDCDCISDISAKVAGNGESSENKIAAELTDGSSVWQDNSCGERAYTFDFVGEGWWKGCGVFNELEGFSDTGSNKAKSNTGDPGDDPMIWTGNSETLVGVENQGNANMFGENPELPEGNHNGVNLNISFDLNDLLVALGLH